MINDTAILEKFNIPPTLAERFKVLKDKYGITPGTSLVAHCYPEEGVFRLEITKIVPEEDLIYYYASDMDYAGRDQAGTIGSSYLLVCLEQDYITVND